MFVLTCVLICDADKLDTNGDHCRNAAAIDDNSHGIALSLAQGLPLSQTISFGSVLAPSKSKHTNRLRLNAQRMPITRAVDSPSMVLN